MLHFTHAHYTFIVDWPYLNQDQNNNSNNSAVLMLLYLLTAFQENMHLLHHFCIGEEEETLFTALFAFSGEALRDDVV